jgi:hypothetical protein
VPVKGSSGKMIYISKYRGSPMLIELSLFKQTVTQEQDKKSNKSSRLMERLGSFGIKLTSINGAPIRLNALEINSLYGNDQDVI